MKDAVGREINIGDIVAFGSPNAGSIDLRIIADKQANEHTADKVFVRGYSEIYREYDREKQEWVDIEPYLRMERGGWTFTSRVIVINESVPENLKKFLRENM